MNRKKIIQKVQIIFGIFCVFAIVCMGISLFYTIFAKTNYPLSKIDELAVPHLDLKKLDDIEGFALATENAYGNSEYPIYNYISKRRKPWSIYDYDISQKYIDVESDSSLHLSTTYVKTWTISQANRVIHHELGVIPIEAFIEYSDNRFDECSVEEAATGLRIAVRKGKQVFALSYEGNLSKDVFLDELAKIL